MPDVPINLDEDVTPTERPKTVGFTDQQFQSLIDAIKGNAADSLAAQAEVHALAMKKQLYPTNETHPDISVFNPRGERDFPKPLLKVEFFLGPYPLEPQTLLVKEVEYLNQLEPGTYEVTKSDGSVVPFVVIPRMRLDGRTIERMTISFPCADDDQKQNYPPFAQMLHEVVDQIALRKIIET